MQAADTFETLLPVYQETRHHIFIFIAAEDLKRDVLNTLWMKCRSFEC
jgi:hypothetical protein